MTLFLHAQYRCFMTCAHTIKTNSGMQQARARYVNRIISIWIETQRFPQLRIKILPSACYRHTRTFPGAWKDVGFATFFFSAVDAPQFFGCLWRNGFETSSGHSDTALKITATAVGTGSHTSPTLHCHVSCNMISKADVRFGWNATWDHVPRIT